MIVFTQNSYQIAQQHEIKHLKHDMIYDTYMMYLLNCNWVATRWQQYSTHLHTTVHRTAQYKQYTEQNKNFRKSAGRAPSLRVLPWHLPYNWVKSTENPHSARVAEECQLARWWRYINIQQEYIDITIKIHKLQY
jgi:hypothetical protein